MRLSKLQKFILAICLESRNSKCEKSVFFRFYGKDDRLDTLAAQVSLQNSLDNLVEKDLLIAYGHHTARKWHIERVKLTSTGKKLIRVVLKGRQRKLPKI